MGHIYIYRNLWDTYRKYGQYIGNIGLIDDDKCLLLIIDDNK